MFMINVDLNKSSYLLYYDSQHQKVLDNRKLHRWTKS